MKFIFVKHQMRFNLRLLVFSPTVPESVAWDLYANTLPLHLVLAVFPKQFQGKRKTCAFVLTWSNPVIVVKKRMTRNAIGTATPADAFHTRMEHPTAVIVLATLPRTVAMRTCLKNVITTVLPDVFHIKMERPTNAGMTIAMVPARKQTAVNFHFVNGSKVIMVNSRGVGANPQAMVISRTVRSQTSKTFYLCTKNIFLITITLQ